MDLHMKNEYLSVSVSSMGAELTSIWGNMDNIEYLWTADPTYWSRHAPILFPIVGKVVNNQYRIGSHTYSLSQHGFARDHEFNVIRSTEKSVALRLTSTEKSLEIYPFSYLLDVEYILRDRSVEISYRVKNTDNKDIYFSIGAHPGFNCPLLEGESLEDYYFEFEKQEVASAFKMDEKGYLVGEQSLFLNNSKIIPLSRELFIDDALIFKGLKSDKIYLKNRRNSRTIMLDFSGFPYLGLWSKPTGAPFVCIEPWFGHADYSDFEGDFRDKEGIIRLGIGNEFECKYVILIAGE